MLIPLLFAVPIAFAISSVPAGAAGFNTIYPASAQTVQSEYAVAQNRMLLALNSNDIEEEDEWDDDLDFDEDETEAMDYQVRDPLAPWNRAMHQVNDKFYYWLLKPAAIGFRAAVPSPIRKGIKNAFRNATAPLRIVSCLLQAKGKSAAGEFVGFMFNSTVGLVGFIDVTKQHPALHPFEEDLGQTFGTWGIGNGIYIVWPFLGPSTLRDSMGTAIERFMNPTSYIDPVWVPISLKVLETVNNTSFRIGDYETLKDAAIEPYEAFRDAYLQNRLKLLAE